MLEIKNISKKFKNRQVLDNISVSVNRGEIAIFLGESGVGKSTLLRVLNNLESLDSGAVYLDGKKLDLNEVNHTHTIGMVFQQFNLFQHLTVQQNITLPLMLTANKTQAQADMIAQALLARYGLGDKANMYVSQLSGGQKQRLALARTLALKPVVICLDEPTSALDPLLTNYVAQTIQDLADQNYVVLVATHDVAILEKLNCTIYLMHEGSIIERASWKELNEHPRKFPRIVQFISGTEGSCCSSC